MPREDFDILELPYELSICNEFKPDDVTKSVTQSESFQWGRTYRR